VKQNYFVLAF